MSTSSVYAKSDWGKVLGIGWLWLLRPDHVFLCITPLQSYLVDRRESKAGKKLKFREVGKPLSEFVLVVGMKGTFAVGTLGGWPPLEVVCCAACGLPL
jgi:hypothetical protein